MAPLTTSEMDCIHKLKAESFTPMQIHAQLVKDRRRRRQQGPDLTTVRRFVKGKTHKRAVTETRGRKKKLSVANVKAMDRARDKLTTQAVCEREISWDEVVRKARVPSVHRTTAAKHMLRELGVKALRPRAKLTRSNIDSVLTRGMPPGYPRTTIGFDIYNYSAQRSFAPRWRYWRHSTQLGHN